MSKTNDTSYGAAATGDRDLTADELDQIAGGPEHSNSPADAT